MPYFEDLEVWKQSCRLAVNLYSTLQNCKDHGLKDQMTRTAVSIPSNIAEGGRTADCKRICVFPLHFQRQCRRTPDPNLYCFKNRDHFLCGM